MKVRLEKLLRVKLLCTYLKMQQSRRHMLFGGCDEDIRNQYSTICEEFDKRGIDIFCKEIRDKIKKEYLSELE